MQWLLSVQSRSSGSYADHAFRSALAATPTVRWLAVLRPIGQIEELRLQREIREMPDRGHSVPPDHTKHLEHENKSLLESCWKAPSPLRNQMGCASGRRHPATPLRQV